MTILEFIKEIEKRLWSVVACHKIGTTSSDLMWNLWKDDKDFRLQIFCKNTDIHRLLSGEILETTFSEIKLFDYYYKNDKKVFIINY